MAVERCVALSAELLLASAVGARLKVQTPRFSDLCTSHHSIYNMLSPFLFLVI